MDRRADLLFGRLKDAVLLAISSSAEEIGAEVTDYARAMRLLRLHRASMSHLGGGLFGYPAASMLLELLSAEHEERVISVSGLCFAVGVPQTTGLRMIGMLIQDGLVSRQRIPGDQRMVRLRLTDRGAERIRSVLRAW